MFSSRGWRLTREDFARVDVCVCLFRTLRLHVADASCKNTSHYVVDQDAMNMDMSPSPFFFSLTDPVPMLLLTDGLKFSSKMLTDEIMDQIEMETGAPKKQQRITYQSKQLTTQQAHYYNIQDNDSVDLSLELQGGNGTADPTGQPEGMSRTQSVP